MSRVLPDLSIVVPAYNEAGNLEPLFDEIAIIMQHARRLYEVILVNDGSTDDTLAVSRHLQDLHPQQVRTIDFRCNVGKASGLQAGFDIARGKRIITIDADLQDDPSEIPRLLAKLDAGYDVVSGWKLHRHDSFLKNSTSKLFNAATNSISSVKLHDFNCGLKAYTAEAARSVKIYGELHRFIPVLLAAKGFRVAELPVNHRRRYSGKSKYGPLRFLKGFFDLVTVIFITRFSSRPLHMFGYIGTVIFSFGVAGGLYLTFVKFIDHQSIGDRPLLLLSAMLIIMGVQTAVIGIVGEHITALIQTRVGGGGDRDVRT
jgi:glycosyltransferase involved in cell wall biosynthesis